MAALQNQLIQVVRLNYNGEKEHGLKLSMAILFYSGSMKGLIIH